ncbi:MAG: diguanylate cyclase [Thermoleophilaceae bacterium]|nr:diguanylate cyclase [Thermoleophilaceae bacterium]
MRILLAEDDPVSRANVDAMVRRLGHESLTANDGAEAWRLFRAERPTVLISDWEMPGLTGLELCRRVRESGPSAEDYTYFILLTVKDQRSEVIAAMRAGVDDHLPKPTRIEQIEARLIVAERVTRLHQELGRRRAALETTNDRLNDLAHRDQLTGLGNRLGLAQEISLLDAPGGHAQPRFSLALIDVDRFKQYNDRHGHPAGDRLLAEVGRCIRSQVRSTDRPYRYGGDEFLIAYLDEPGVSAALAVERLRSRIEAATACPSLPEPATVTIGLASAEPGERFDVVIARADAALYREKRRRAP